MTKQEIIDAINTLYGIVNSNSANQFLNDDELKVAKEKLMQYINLL